VGEKPGESRVRKGDIPRGKSLQLPSEGGEDFRFW